MLPAEVSGVIADEKKGIYITHGSCFDRCSYRI